MTYTSSSAQCLPGLSATITCYTMRPAEPTNPSRAPRTLPRTHISPNTLPRPQHQVCSCTPSARIMATQHTPRPRPIPNSLRLPLCCRRSKLSTGLWDDRRLFSKMHSAYGLNFDFWKHNLGFGYNCHAIHFTRFTNNTLFPQPLFSLLQLCGFMSLAGVTSPRTGYHRDGMARVAVVLFRSSNFLQSPLLLFLSIVVDVLWFVGV
jgi:hypothetical protein